jgi:aryl-alcohol dehydrogenase-like predicted oxidoreductase
MLTFKTTTEAIQALANYKQHRIKIAETSIPKRKLGQTGLEVGIFSLGGQGALESQRDKEEMAEIIQRAYELGVNYFDTSPIYGPSEDYYGYAIPNFRSNIILATKSDKRNRDGALEDIENSLKRLNTDWIDIWQIHHVDKMEEVEEIFGPGGALEAFKEMKDQGVAKHIGITGHEDPRILVEMLRRFPFETVLCIANAADCHVYPSFEQVLYPAANQIGAGIIGMKIFAQGYIFHPDGITTTWEPLYYAMSQPISTIIVGCDSVAQLEENVALTKGFYQLNEKQLDEIRNKTKKYQERGAFFRKEFGGYQSQEKLKKLIIFEK